MWLKQEPTEAEVNLLTGLSSWRAAAHRVGQEALIQSPEAWEKKGCFRLNLRPLLLRCTLDADEPTVNFLLLSNHSRPIVAFLCLQQITACKNTVDISCVYIYLQKRLYKIFQSEQFFGWTSARSSLNPKLALHASHPGPVYLLPRRSSWSG